MQGFNVRNLELHPASFASAINADIYNLIQGNGSCLVPTNIVIDCTGPTYNCIGATSVPIGYVCGAWQNPENWTDFQFEWGTYGFDLAGASVDLPICSTMAVCYSEDDGFGGRTCQPDAMTFYYHQTAQVDYLYGPLCD